MEKGHYKVILVDSTQSIHEGTPSVADICRLIGCDTLDTVCIDRDRQVVMFVDDNGMIAGKPVNLKATALYHAVCQPGTEHQIHGNVVIVNDRDLAPVTADEE
jgi:hypothetical protein